MKSALRLALFTALSLTVDSFTAVQAETPKLDAAKAARIATDYLAKLGGNAPHIVSLSLDQSALIRGEQSWVVKWSEPVLDGENREVGARIKMDGSISFLVEDTKGKMERATRRPLLR